ncbi:pol polyprotein, partial [Trifolium medium]|nr:pol polyprotein [Trifolium medium]
MTDGSLARCLGKDEAYTAVSDIHEGICGAHQAGDKMFWVLKRQGVFWPTMAKNCFEFAKGC